ncbi:MAG: tRNA (guanosine(46)-N7)-methyltransferase TrmB [Betaproteobacteria bacterium]
MISPQRHIRSFVLRQGRVSNAQRRAVDSLLPLFGIAYSAAPFDFDAAFARRAPKFLEIGFGMGETTARIAADHSQNDYLGIEVHTPGVGGLLRLIDAQRLSNIRIIQHDAVEVVAHMIPPASLSGIHVFFPDPWPKKRHHKRRLLQPEFVHLLAGRLQSGGYLHVATDWEEYALQILEVLSGEALLVNSVEGFAPRPDHRPLTKFESRGLKLGHQVRDIVFVRR